MSAGKNQRGTAQSSCQSEPDDFQVDPAKLQLHGPINTIFFKGLKIYIRIGSRSNLQTDVVPWPRPADPLPPSLHFMDRFDLHIPFLRFDYRIAIRITISIRHRQGFAHGDAFHLTNLYLIG